MQIENVLEALGFEFDREMLQEPYSLKLVKGERSHGDYGLEGTLCQVNEAHQQLLEDLQERAAALRILLEEEQSLAEDLKEARQFIETETYKATTAVNNMIQYAENEIKELDQVMVATCLRAATVKEEPDYEAVIEELEGDLQVVYTVPQTQVRRAVEKWHKAIKKELDNLFNTGTLRRITMKQAVELQRQGKTTPGTKQLSLHNETTGCSRRSTTSEVQVGTLWEPRSKGGRLRIAVCGWSLH